jgi:hypothetical protein
MFKTDLITKEVDDDWSQVLSPFIYFSERFNTTIKVEPGFLTDFASVPRVPIAYMLCGGHGKKAATIHDLNYSSAAFPKRWADLMFYDGLKETLLPKLSNLEAPTDMQCVWFMLLWLKMYIVCVLMYIGVAIGGWGTWWKYKGRRKKGLPLRPDAPDVELDGIY